MARRRDRRHRRASRLGPGDDPPSSCPLRRAGWRSLAGQVDVDRMSAGLLSARARAVTPVPAALSGCSRQGLRSRRTALLQRPRPSQRRRHVSPAISRSLGASNGSPMQSRLSAVRTRCSPISADAPNRVAIANTRIVELDDDHVALRLSGNGCDREKIMCLHPHEFIRRFLLHLLPAGSTACVTSAFSLTVIDGCRMLLGQPSPPGGQSHSSETPRGKSYECPDCRRPTRRTGINIPPVAPPRPSSFRCDTS